VSNTHQGKTSQQASCGQGNKGAESHHAKEQMEMREALRSIKHKIVILSGKGGVGKSSVAANLAVTLSRKGLKTGLLDTDLHGPSIPTLLGIEDKDPGQKNGRMTPVPFSDTLKVMSVGLLVKDRTEAIVWRGPAKHGVIKEFLTCVDWGELDYLVVDCPPGTGDEPLSVIQLLQNVDGAVIVTTPQELALVDVRKSVTFCRHLNLPVIGIVENMSGHVCPHCGESTDIFKSGGGEQLAEKMGVPFLGRIPLDSAMVSAGDDGKPFMGENRDTPADGAMRDIFAKVHDFVG
jgi:ATP-binding protein involved in chromosome partitioning